MREDSAKGVGGLIRGPGTGSSDSIPATIEGLKPVRLSNGEAVLNAEAVKLLGDDFINRINSASLVGLKRKPRDSEHRIVQVFLKEKVHV